MKSFLIFMLGCFVGGFIMLCMVAAASINHDDENGGKPDEHT